MYLGELLMKSKQFKPNLYGDDAVSTFFTCVMTFGSSDGIEFKLTKNVVESQERWIGLGLL